MLWCTNPNVEPLDGNDWKEEDMDFFGIDEFLHDFYRAATTEETAANINLVAYVLDVLTRTNYTGPFKLELVSGQLVGFGAGKSLFKALQAVR